jgi:DnaJ-domain-containing protein 1
MGILDRLSDVIRSYLQDDNDETIYKKTGSRTTGRRNADSDYNAAWEELDDFLNGHQRNNSGGTRQESERPSAKKPEAPPEELRGDFTELGVSFGAPAAECKAAYKKLLKIHHPDRHAGHPGNMKKATEKSARINAAYDRIEKWRNQGG